MNRRGRKIYRTRAGNRKRRTQNFFKALFVIILLAALVFIGYSVGQPIHDYFVNREETGSAEDDTAPWTPPVLPDESGDAGAEVTEAASETAASEEEKERDFDFSAYQLPESALLTSESFTTALENLKGSGYTAVVATLKAEGGKFYYKTTSQMALSDEDAIVGTMYSGQIASMIKNAGFIPIAKINLLEDHNLYGEYKMGSYHFEGSTSTWLDNSVENGGKPWLSPFDTDTQSFAAYLANEASSAGFEYVVFDGIVFPPFRNSDLNYIGSIVKAADKYKSLISLADIAAKAAETNDSGAVISVSAGDVLMGRSDVFKPAELTVKRVSAEYIPNEIENTAVINGEEVALSEMNAYDKAVAVFGEIKRLAGEDITIIPALRQTDFSQADFNDTITAFMDLGFDSYIILS